MNNKHNPAEQSEPHIKIGKIERFIEPLLFGFRVPVLLLFFLASVLFAYEN